MYIGKYLMDKILVLINTNLYLIYKKENNFII